MEIIVGSDTIENILSFIRIKKGKILYKHRPLKFIHTHFNLDYFKIINEYFIRLLTQAKYSKELMCINYVIHSN